MSLSDHQAILEQYLKRKGLKNTHQRKIIFETFLKSKGHLSIENLLTKVRKKDANIGYATVYRNLQVLQESGLAVKLELEGQSLFEKAGKHHDHLICIQCGKIEEFEEESIERVQDLIAEQFGFDLISHRHELYGKCPECKK